MQAEVALNVQQSIRPGECVDTYYAGKENSQKQCHATVEDNRFFTAIGSGNPASGSSATITFNPNQGLGEVICVFRIPTQAANAGFGANVGWGYNLIRRVGYRYGSSQLFYISGAQNLMQTLALCEDSGKKQAIFELGGQAIATNADRADNNKRVAYVYLRLPHSSPALAGGALPFPTDLLTAPIQIQLDLNDFTSVFSQQGAGAPPAQLEFAQMNFTQVTMQNPGDLLARRFDMARHALAVPLPECWTQEAVAFPIQTGADGSFQISLTGCKAGDLKKLRVWFVLPGDVPGAGGINNPNLWRAPSSVSFAINGLIYMDSRDGSWALTNLLRRRTTPAVSYSALTAYANPNYTVTPVSSQWVEIDLAQPHAIGDTGEVALVHGVPVMNSVLTLSGTMPLGNTQYVCYAEYNLNASWLATRGSADFVF